MGIQITQREVLNNLIRFKESIEKSSKFSSKKQNREKRVYLTLLNLDTGDIRFAQKISTLEDSFQQTPIDAHSYKNWKQVRLVVQEKEGRATFEVCDATGQPLQPSDFHQPIAWTVVSEMMQVLNTIARLVTSGEFLPEDKILSSTHLSEVQISPAHDHIESLKEWVGSLNRTEAEYLLWDKPVGAYVIRELDPIAESIALALKEGNRISFLRSCLLTIVEKNNKISDILLIRTERGWIFYQDNVDLSSSGYSYYPSIQSILHDITLKIRGITDF